MTAPFKFLNAISAVRYIHVLVGEVQVNFFQYVQLVYNARGFAINVQLALIFRRTSHFCLHISRVVKRLDFNYSNLPIQQNLFLDIWVVSSSPFRFFFFYSCNVELLMTPQTEVPSLNRILSELASLSLTPENVFDRE